MDDQAKKKKTTPNQTQNLCLMTRCGGLALAECQVATKTSLSLPSLEGQGRETITKGS